MYSKCTVCSNLGIRGPVPTRCASGRRGSTNYARRSATWRGWQSRVAAYRCPSRAFLRPCSPEESFVNKNPFQEFETTPQADRQADKHAALQADRLTGWPGRPPSQKGQKLQVSQFQRVQRFFNDSYSSGVFKRWPGTRVRPCFRGESGRRIRLHKVRARCHSMAHGP